MSNSLKITVYDYETSNSFSVQRALKRIGFNSTKTNNRNQVKKSHIVFLPGVGNFRSVAYRIRERGCHAVLKEKVLDNDGIIVGICVGFQLMCKSSEEKDNHSSSPPGLGLIDGSVVSNNFQNSNKKTVVGWDYVNIKKGFSFHNKYNGYYYFNHSYNCILNKRYHSKTIWLKNGIVAGLKYGNIYGLQFHPERSGIAGLSLLHKIISDYQHE